MHACPQQICFGNIHVPGPVLGSADIAVSKIAEVPDLMSSHSTKGDKTTKNKRIKICVVRWWEVPRRKTEQGREIEKDVFVTARL